MMNKIPKIKERLSVENQALKKPGARQIGRLQWQLPMSWVDFKKESDRHP